MLKSWIKSTGALLLVLGFGVALTAQPITKEPSRFDYGRMWTFENAPVDYLKSSYDMEVDEEWLTRARMSSLRFASWCSSSFVSPNGLIMTNHHCSRGEMGKVMKDGEDFDKNGFYAETLADERKVEGLFVSQLRQIADITDMVQGYINQAKTDEERQTKIGEAFEAAQAKYGAMSGWEGLDIQPVTYYSGMRFSLYGYKKYEDIRLVMIPELQLGYYGGDADNFTFPRYNLDCTFWRAYEDGKPVNTTDFHFPVNVDGVHDGTPVFVIGNPGSTERYRTMAQLEYDRDYRYNIQVEMFRNRMAIMQEKLDEKFDHDLQEFIFGVSNSEKAISGIIGGMYMPDLMSRKSAMEDKIRNAALKSGSPDYWAQLADAYGAISPYSAEIRLLAPGNFGETTISLLHQLYSYKQSMEGDASDEDLQKARTEIKETAAGLTGKYEIKYLTALLQELNKYAGSDAYMSKVLKGRTPAVAAKEILADTKFTNPDEIDKLFKKDKNIKKNKDVMLELADVMIPEYYEAAQVFRSSGASRRAIEASIANEVYKVYGVDIPPDATFTLRLADGVVKGYDYNGTKAPFYTTYFGLYDRHYSHLQEFPWSLPEKWMNPPMELLKTPMNFVSTNDITGGNSGSPIVNKDLEVVGLIFDGNIESLPGNFIFDEEANRSVSVHAGGIVAALRYIYKADRLVNEMTKK